MDVIPVGYVCDIRRHRFVYDEILEMTKALGKKQ